MALLNFTQLQDVFYNVTFDITGMPSTSIRHAYQGIGQPGIERAQDIVYINLNYVNDDYYSQRHVMFSGDLDDTDATREVFYTKVISVQWSFYGPQSFDLADSLRNGLFNDSPNEILSASEIFPVLGFPSPVRAPYSFNKQWWERVDFTANFNVGVSRTGTTPYLQSGEVQINKPSESGGSDIIFTVPITEN